MLEHALPPLPHQDEDFESAPSVSKEQADPAPAAAAAHPPGPRFLCASCRWVYRLWAVRSKPCDETSISVWGTRETCSCCYAASSPDGDKASPARQHYQTDCVLIKYVFLLFFIVWYLFQLLVETQLILTNEGDNGTTIGIGVMNDTGSDMQTLFDTDLASKGNILWRSRSHLKKLKNFLLSLSKYGWLAKIMYLGLPG